MTKITGHGAARLRILDETGHTEFPVDVADEARVAEARALFDQLRADGHTAFAVDADGTSTPVEEYDPRQDVVVIPQLAGGR